MCVSLCVLGGKCGQKTGSGKSRQLLPWFEGMCRLKPSLGFVTKMDTIRDLYLALQRQVLQACSTGIVGPEEDQCSVKSQAGQQV